jgi:hypothetical protein
MKIQTLIQSGFFDKIDSIIAFSKTCNLEVLQLSPPMNVQSVGSLSMLCASNVNTQIEDFGKFLLFLDELELNFEIKLYNVNALQEKINARTFDADIISNCLISAIPLTELTQEFSLEEQFDAKKKIATTPKKVSVEKKRKIESISDDVLTLSDEHLVHSQKLLLSQYDLPRAIKKSKVYRAPL